MKGNPHETYTVTLDDDPMVHEVVEKSTKIRNIGFQNPQDLIARADNLEPVGVFIGIQLGTGQNGLEIIPRLRSFWPYCPILVITGTPTEQNISRALNSGADDFVRKPLIPDEVNARLKLRMADAAQKAAKEVVEFGDIIVDSSHRTVEGPQGKRFASPIEVSLLSCLAANEGSIVEKDALKMRCWGQLKVTDNALHRKLHAVRQLLRDISPNVVIETKYGVGFALRYNPPLEAAS